MSDWSTIRGHAQQLDQLQRTAQAGRLGHAYLFLGPEGIGKRTFARQLAKCLLCYQTGDAELAACGTCSSCKQVNAGTHPDLLEVGLPEEKNVVPIRLIAGEDDERGRAGLCYDLSLSPMECTRRVAILDSADHLEEAGASALLKTLEEPPSHAILILVATSLSEILPTIQSRCQHVRFSVLDDADVAALLLEQEKTTDPEEAARVAGLANGSLVQAALMQDPAMSSLRETLYENLAARPMDPLKTIDQVVEAWEEASSDTYSKRQNATWLIRFAIEFYRAVLRYLAGVDAESRIPQVNHYCRELVSGDAEAIDRISDMLERCLEAENEPLVGNVMLPMGLEALFYELAKTSRQGVPIA